MEFNDSPEEAAWRAEYRAWLEEHAPAVVGPLPERALELGASADYLARAKQWQAIKFDAGFARITWEPEFGGRNGTTMQQIIFGQEEARFAVPTEAFIIGLGMIAPTIRARRNRRATAALSHEAAARRGDLVPALQRTGRGLRCRVTVHDRDPRRRRVGDQRAEGVDVGRAVLRLR